MWVAGRKTRRACGRFASTWARWATSWACALAAAACLTAAAAWLAASAACLAAARVAGVVGIGVRVVVVGGVGVVGVVLVGMALPATATVVKPGDPPTVVGGVVAVDPLAVAVAVLPGRTGTVVWPSAVRTLSCTAGAASESFAVFVWSTERSGSASTTIRPVGESAANAVGVR